MAGSDSMDKLDSMMDKNMQLTKIIREKMKDNELTMEQVMLALIVEAAEVLQELKGWKWWSENNEFDREKVLVESIDLFHFLLELWELLDASSEEVYQSYLEKNEINIKRQRDEY